ncbi:hypothetical protein CVT24_010441 [Panaeolus cyanescens]|uniref:ABC transporter domain-containing protein n=1 Tax=Panaeolus cyanescens TaxID=181874 RepID=A0A409WTW5_9AGAR|nr:hypothetical protein CVT24_010441 [Panaeolus cyanescens]
MTSPSATIAGMRRRNYDVTHQYENILNRIYPDFLKNSGMLLVNCVQTYQLLHEAPLKEGHTAVDCFHRLLQCSPSQLALVATYLYASILAFFAIGTGPLVSLMRKHVVVILLVVTGVYVYRDIIPWMTYTLQPMDSADGQLLYIRLVLLCISAIIVPLFIPRIYVPIDPKNPMEVPNPEQTASIFSLAFYTFLDPIVKEASVVPHLPFHRLPPLADYDCSAHLKKTSFPHLDQFHGRKRRHMFWSLMHVFSWEYSGMALCLTFMSLTRFISPLALNRILEYMENGDTQGRIMTPWFWVGSLLVAPAMGTVAWQWYIFLATRCLARTQAIFTQLIFEHSLRIQFKAETSSDATLEGDVESRSGGDEQDAQSQRTAAVEGNAKAKDGGMKPAPQHAEKENLIGKINTLVTVDLDTILNTKDFLTFVLQVPLELVLAGVFLYKILGWSSFVGCASILLMLPIPGYVTSLIQKYHKAKMAKTDARVDAIAEAVGVLRMIKLFGWEKKMSRSLNDKREEELVWVWKSKVIELLNGIINSIIPTITMVVTYATFTIIMKQSLTPSIVFSSMVIFDVVRIKFHTTSWGVGQIMRGKVALERIQSFLRETDLLDEFDEKSAERLAKAASHIDEMHESVIGFKDCVFTWDALDGDSRPTSRAFRLKIEGELCFRRDCINLIVGPTGAGKTSVLMALLGEMHYNPSSADSWYHLPRAGGIAYAAQESWVQNDTIRNNILFGAPYDDERYKKVIYQCALTKDLELFDTGDHTEVGEMGLTLSGGQKARVTLARALYSSAEILLLDDILVALDVHTSRWIVKECLQGDLIQGRTVLLVTHNVALAGPIAGFFVTVDSNGAVKEAGTTLSSTLALSPAMEEEFEAEKDAVEEATKEETSAPNGTKLGTVNKATGKLILAEEIQQGSVTWKAITLYLRALGGKRPVFFAAVCVVSMLASPVASSFSVWFLGHWSGQYKGRSPEEVDVFFYLSMYILTLIGMEVFMAFNDIYYITGAQRASRYINNTLVESILTSTLRWLDETPASRIISRCTQDIGTIDNELASTFQRFATVAFIMAVKLVAPLLFAPTGVAKKYIGLRICFEI